MDRFANNTLDLCRQIVEKRDSMFFRAGKFAKDIEVELFLDIVHPLSWFRDIRAELRQHPVVYIYLAKLNHHLV